jgi:signal transduction histidine kinase
MVPVPTRTYGRCVTTTTSPVPVAARWRRPLRPPWTAAGWSDTATLVLGGLIGLLAGTVVISLACAAAALAVTAVLAVPVLAALVGCGRVFAGWQRARLRAMRGISIPPAVQRHPGTTRLARLRAAVTAAPTWRQLGYHALTAVTGPLLATAAVGCWAVGGVCGTVVLHGWLLPHRVVLGRPLPGAVTFGVLTAIGLVLVAAAPRVAALGVRLDVALATALLAPSRREQLAGRVATLARSRSDVIDAADAERRRIERDLHDGTQQRLVSVAMHLGMTRTTLTDVPEPVRHAIEHAHEETKLALADLRDVVRGLHPAILDDLGLDAALTGIVARSPIPVRLLVDLPERPPRRVETVAYYVVSEALSNIAKHSGATRVDVLVERAGDGPLLTVVSDDGRGGADPDRGTGLRGLQQRVRSVDGTVSIDSPPGGPTRITVELPCES